MSEFQLRIFQKIVLVVAMFLTMTSKAQVTESANRAADEAAAEDKKADADPKAALAKAKKKAIIDAEKAREEADRAWSRYTTVKNQALKDTAEAAEARARKRAETAAQRSEAWAIKDAEKAREEADRAWSTYTTVKNQALKDTAEAAEARAMRAEEWVDAWLEARENAEKNKK